MPSNVSLTPTGETTHLLRTENSADNSAHPRRDGHHHPWPRPQHLPQLNGYPINDLHLDVDGQHQVTQHMTTASAKSLQQPAARHQVQASSRRTLTHMQTLLARLDSPYVRALGLMTGGGLILSCAVPTLPAAFVAAPVAKQVVVVLGALLVSSLSVQFPGAALGSLTGTAAAAAATALGVPGAGLTMLGVAAVAGGFWGATGNWLHNLRDMGTKVFGYAAPLLLKMVLVVAVLLLLATMIQSGGAHLLPSSLSATPGLFSFTGYA